MEVSTPVSLSAICIQALVAATQIEKPPTLFVTCVDIISWNQPQRYRASLILPFSMKTASCIAELQRIARTSAQVHFIVSSRLLYMTI